MSLLRLVVVVVVALPLFLLVGWPHPWWATFLIAAVAFGAAHGVEALVQRGKETAPTHIPEKRQDQE
jgi:hypothetical protein